MNNTMQGEITLTFIRGGVSAKGNSYLQVSNGRREFFVNIPKDLDIDEDTFDDFEENDQITIEAKVLAGSDTVTLISLV